MVEINEPGLDKPDREIGDKIGSLDRRFRDAHGGEEADAILAQARGEFARIGVRLPDEQLRAYARSVSSREPFEFLLT
jgi:hypothetical protein